MHLVRLRLLRELREVHLVEAGGALELGAARLVLLRAARGATCASSRRAFSMASVVAATFAGSPCVRDHGPPLVYWAMARSNVDLDVRVVLDGRVPRRDLQHPLPRVAARRLELDEELVRLDAALVVRLVVVLLGEGADDLAAEALAADLREEVVEVLRGVLLVLREDLDDVLERLALELVELLALGRVGRLAAGPLVGRLEDADEALRGLVVVSQAPVAPGALEEGQPVERRIDAVLVGEDLLVLGERPRVVELPVEDGLGLRHVRVGHEAALRVVLEDALEPVARLVLLALLEGEEAVDVEGQVVSARTRDSPGGRGRRDRAIPGSRARGWGRACRRASSPSPRSGPRSRRARSPTGAHLDARAPRASRAPRAGSRRRTSSGDRWPRHGAPWSAPRRRRPARRGAPGAACGGPPGSSARGWRAARSIHRRGRSPGWDAPPPPARRLARRRAGSRPKRSEKGAARPAQARSSASRQRPLPSGVGGRWQWPSPPQSVPESVWPSSAAIRAR